MIPHKKSNNCIYDDLTWTMVEVFHDTLTLTIANGIKVLYKVPMGDVICVPPVEVTADNFYRTLAGFPVVIHEIGDPNKSTCNAKGSIYHKGKGLHNNPRYNCWKSYNGASVFIGGSIDDLVKISEDKWTKLVNK